MTGSVVVLIPAYKPDAKMLPLCRALRGKGLDVLLVDDGQCEVGKLHRVFDDSVCADKNFHIAAYQAIEHLAAALALDDAREQFHAYWHVAEKVANGGEVLLCQDLRGCHDAGLIAVVDRQEHGHEGHERLARAYIALQQTVHLLS